MSRIYLAFLCFFRVLFGKALPEAVQRQALPEPQLGPAPVRDAPAPRVTPAAQPTPVVKPKPDPAPGALQLLGMLQREGRLVDFLRESIDGYDDATVGVAVRDIHRGCKKVLDEHFELEPVLAGAENDPVVVDKSEPNRVRLVGNVSGQPPFRGVLRHHGWRATSARLPSVADGIDLSILAPAEVEL